MTVALRTDPKHEPDAYITREGSLYEVECYEPTGSNSGKLWVRNSLTGQRLWLSAREVSQAVLVKAAPPLTVPATTANG